MQFARRKLRDKSLGFPHSEISGSKIAWHLTGAYRSFATSFIAFLSQGIHHMLLYFLLGNITTTINFLHKSFTICALTFVLNIRGWQIFRTLPAFVNYKIRLNFIVRFAKFLLRKILQSCPLSNF